MFTYVPKEFACMEKIKVTWLGMQDTVDGIVFGGQ